MEGALDLNEVLASGNAKTEMSSASIAVFETGTQYAKILPGTSGTIDVIFTQAKVPPGTFNLQRAGKGINTKILLNMADNDCYQRGVSGIADSIEGVADWLRRQISALGGGFVRMVGFSSGGTAAIIFGDLLKADCVIAVGPETQLGLPGYRSYDWNPHRNFHKHFQDARPFMRRLGSRLSIVLAAWDLTDYRHIYVAMRTKHINLIIVPGMHCGANQFEWRAIMKAPGAVDLTGLALNGLYDWKFNSGDVWRGVAAFEAIGRSDDLALKLFEHLLSIDPANPGLHYRIAMQKLLLGDQAGAIPFWRYAAAQIAAATPLPLEQRYDEYRVVVPRAAWRRMVAFVGSMGVTPPAKTPYAIDAMGSW